ncbi:subtilase family protein [Chryseobacterium sp. 7]|uniref:S8 family serine peptidase n=1 Tax=Chryseobacterium sp. 7 TaxID=2035214 RepID=UPI000EB263CD|nr:S8 family serine peptidase [Chryseobacterium sp. 7]RLJ33785.1 subtilase family protein [Chryseobacterium sp. 7]
MTIGIIDTGCDRNHKRFVDLEIEGLTIYKNANNEIITVKDRFSDNKGHGTGITSIIHKNSPLSKIIVVKIESFDHSLSEDLLVEAIEYLTNHTDAKILNISMGVNTNNPSVQLKEACQFAFDKGVIVVASAYYKHDSLCFPANFKSVFAVGSGIVKSKESFRFLGQDSFVNILAKGGFQRVAVPQNKYQFSTGTSLATAHFTAILADAYEKGEWKTRDELNNWISGNSDNNTISLTKHDQLRVDHENISAKEERTFQEVFTLDKSVENFAIFPFEEKEMKTLIEFREHLNSNLTLAIGSPRSIKLDNTMELLQEKGINFITKALNPEHFDLFDTIVIGYFLDKLSDSNSFFGFTLIKECIKRNKNFIVWDKAVYDIINQVINDDEHAYTGKLFLTSFDNDKKDFLYRNVDYVALKRPSICVVGTNSRQGKFTTQMIIRKVLEKEGYKVSHISTEPQGILLNSSCVFPIGHNGTVSVDLREWNKSLRLLSQSIELNEEPDIIITGSQGGILPLHPVNDSLPPEKLIYVKSFYPDAIVCTISPSDSIDVIQRTVNTIKSFVETEVLFFVLTPWQYKFHHGYKTIVSFDKIDEEEYNEKLIYFTEKLGKKVINIKDENHHNIIVDEIVNFFAKEKEEVM